MNATFAHLVGLFFSSGNMLILLSTSPMTSPFFYHWQYRDARNCCYGFAFRVAPSHFLLHQLTYSKIFKFWLLCEYCGTLQQGVQPKPCLFLFSECFSCCKNPWDQGDQRLVHQLIKNMRENFFSNFFPNIVHIFKVFSCLPRLFINVASVLLQHAGCRTVQKYSRKLVARHDYPKNWE